MSESNVTAQRMRFSAAINKPTYQDMIRTALTDPARCKRFVASITSAVSATPALQDCTPQSILSGALLGDSLGLSPSPQLGQFYLVPFDAAVKDSKGGKIYLTDEQGNKLTDKNGRWIAKTVKQAEFVLGYKGYIQLAVRSGNYRRLTAMEVKEGELISYNPFTEAFDAIWICDPVKREQEQTIGYVASFEMINGFQKTIYATRESIINHADKYSAAFSRDNYAAFSAGNVSEKDRWKYSSPWYQDFDEMAKKTMLRRLISRWGVMSIEMQNAYESDGRMIEHQDGLLRPVVQEPEENPMPHEAVPETPKEDLTPNAARPEESGTLSLRDL